jgi:hypothetical protein
LCRLAHGYEKATEWHTRHPDILNNSIASLDLGSFMNPSDYTTRCAQK